MVIWLKGLAIGFATGTLTMGVVSLMSYLTDGQEPEAAQPAQAAALAAVAQPDAQRPPVAKVQALAAEQQADVQPLQPAPVADATPPQAAASPGATPSIGTRPTRAEELSTLDSVRSALAAKNPRAALAELDQYETRYPSLTFGLQAQLLRIEALAATGQPQAARDLAATFVSANPDSPHTPKLRAFVAGEAWGRGAE